MRLRWRRLHRSPLVFWVAAAALATMSGMVVARIVGTAEARARELGGLVEVAVAAGPLPVGAVLDDGDVVWQRLPAALVPDSPALGHGEVDGRVVVVPMVAGEVVVEAKVGPEGAVGVAALVEPGRRALAVPVGGGMPTLEPGHRVDLLATFEAGADDGPAATGAEPTFAVAEDAEVVGVTDDVITVAVDAVDAPRVAFALATAVVTLAVRGPDPR